MNSSATRSPITVLIVNPSPDVYGADLQMLESASAMLDRGWRVVVALSSDGELVPRLRACGAEVRFVKFPVLRKASASPGGLARMLGSALGAFKPARRLISELRPAALYVNTVTLPWWLVYGRLTSTPVICHLHEAERDSSRVTRTALMIPLRLAKAVIVISTAAFDAMIDVAPHLRDRAELIYNGVPDSPLPVEAAVRGCPMRVLTIGRLSPRKAPDVTLEAVARLRSDGRDVVVELAGSTFEGYGWFEAQLRERAEQDDLRGAVTFSGYCSPIWPVLERADIVVAPSPNEPFGNAVVEAQLALRPVVATGAQGHLESIADQETGLLVDAGCAAAIATSIAQLIDDEALALEIADRARRSALEKFSTGRYGEQVTSLIERVAGLRKGGSPPDPGSETLGSR